MDEKEKISLSEDLKYWRAERPDEWTMDRFIGKAEALEMFAQKEIEAPGTIDNSQRSEINRLATGALESLSDRNLVMLKLLIDDISRLTSPI